MLSRSLPLALTLLAAGWAALLFITPVLLSRTGPSPVLVAVYAGAGFVCHQRPERSFSVGGTQLPVCARCSGLYVAGAAGAVAALVVTAGRVRAGSRGVRIALALAAAPTAISVASEWLGVASPSNAARAAAALPLGAVAGWIFVRLLSDPNGRADMIG